jgi:hypothetical protein
MLNQSWAEIFGEHLYHLADAQFDGPMAISMIGHPNEQAALKEIVKATGLIAAYTMQDASRNHGYQWEHGTLELVRNYAIANPDDIIMYAHTKGAHEPHLFNNYWRRSMEIALVDRWKPNRNALHLGGYDAIGSYWLTPEYWTKKLKEKTGADFGPTPYFGGNYWMAKASYLRTLPKLIPSEDRFDAERWIGTNRPNVINMIDGWPGDNNFVDEAADT